MAGSVKQLLSAPLAEVLLQVGRAVIETQTALDTHSLELHRRLEATKEELGTALSAPWFHIPEVEVDVHVALEYQGKKASAGKPGYRRLNAALINSAYQNFQQFDVNAASTLKVTFRSVPDQT